MPESSALEKAALQTANRENQLRFVVNVGARRWLLIMIFMLLGAVVYGVLGYFMYKEHPAKWTASTDLVLRQSIYDTGILKELRIPEVVENTPSSLVEGSTDLADEVARALVQEDIIEGGSLGAVATEEEYDLQVDAIRSALTLDPFDRDGRIRVSANAATREQATRIADAAARMLVVRNRRDVVDGVKRRHEIVLQDIDDVTNQFDAAKARLWELSSEMGYKTRDDVTKEIETKSRQIIEAQTTRQEIKAKMTGIEAKLKEKNAQLPQALGQITNSVVNKLMGELDALVKKKIELEMVWKPAFEELQDLEADIAEKKRAICDAVDKLDGGVQGGTNVWTELEGLRRQYTDLQLQLTALDIRTATIGKLIEQMKATLPDLKNKNSEYLSLVRSCEHYGTQINRLLDIETQIRTAIRRGGPSQLERKGSVDATRISAATRRVKAWLNFIIGGGIGLILGFALAIMLEMLDTSIHTIDDVTTHIGLPVLGTIPLMQFGRGRRRHRGNYVPINDEDQVDACIVTQHDPKSPISEAYRTLRTNFQFATIQKKPKTIMVTSSVPGEGKTTTAVNMAVTFADSGMRVLIIDTDLRRPHVHHVLKMKRGPGLADVLREGIDIHSVTRQTRVRNLSIVSSGRVPPNPSELIGSQRMRDLMAELGSEFDLVICDAPSILVVTDPVLLATEVDALVLVVAVDNARRETIIRGKELLATARANVAGVVVNGLKATRRHYYYYYYYYEDTGSRRRKRWINI